MDKADVKDRWVRAEDGIIGGVCLAFARQLNMDPWIVRVIWLFAFMFMGSGLFAYILCLIALPRTDKMDKAYSKKILGVCLRLAQRGNIEVGLVRLMSLILLMTTGGLALIAYFIFHFTLPFGEPPATQSRSII